MPLTRGFRGLRTFGVLALLVAPLLPLAPPPTATQTAAGTPDGVPAMAHAEENSR